MVKKYMELEQYGTDLIGTAWDRAVLRIRFGIHNTDCVGTVRYGTVPFSLFATSFLVKHDGTVPFFFIRSVADPGSSTMGFYLNTV